VGREQAATAKQASTSAGDSTSESDEATRARVTSLFVKAAVTAIEDWIASVGDPALAVYHGPRSDHFLRIGGKTQLYYYYAREWIFANLYNATPPETQRLGGLSKPSSIKPSGNGLRFHLISDADWHLVRDIIRDRLAATKIS
jgi:hypothetical protein